MHEVSIAQSIVQTVLHEANKQHSLHVESVDIEIGELTFLGIDQIAFWIKTGFKGTLAENADIKLKQVKGIIRCKACKYQGDLKLQTDPIHHISLPTFSCPHCQGSEIEIIQGKEAIIRRIKILKN
ncbi:hydrogenase maturation nickel metallochaperone HypA [bacterium]|nr:hydrogenase maturation nickel metallochaperone HypA [bacterium]